MTTRLMMAMPPLPFPKTLITPCLPLSCWSLLSAMILSQNCVCLFMGCPPALECDLPCDRSPRNTVPRCIPAPSQQLAHREALKTPPMRTPRNSPMQSNSLRTSADCKSLELESTLGWTLELKKMKMKIFTVPPLGRKHSRGPGTGNAGTGR